MRFLLAGSLLLVLVACGGSAPAPTALPTAVAVHGAATIGTAVVLHDGPISERVTLGGASAGAATDPHFGCNVVIENIGPTDAPVGTLRVRWSDGTETETQVTQALGVPLPTVHPAASSLSPGANGKLGGLYDRPPGASARWIRYALPSGAAVFFDF